MGIAIEVTGLMELEARLASMVRGLKDPTPMLEDMGAYMIQSTSEHFEDEKGPDGEEWELKPSTVQQKQRSGYTKKLQVTGNLKNSLTRNVKGKLLEVGTPEEYGRYLQEGTSKMKAKKFLGVTDEDKRVLEDIAKKHIKRVIG